MCRLCSDVRAACNGVRAALQLRCTVAAAWGRCARQSGGRGEGRGNTPLREGSVRAACSDVRVACSGVRVASLAWAALWQCASSVRRAGSVKEEFSGMRIA